MITEKIKHENRHLRKRFLNKQIDIGYDANFTNLLGLSKLKAEVGGNEIPTKAKACLDEILKLWAIYETHKGGDGSTRAPIDTSSVIKAYSYDEVLAEYEA